MLVIVGGMVVTFIRRNEEERRGEGLKEEKNDKPDID